MALDNARLESLEEASQLARAAGSEQSSESEDMELPSKSKPNDICAKEQQLERQRRQPLEYKYSPLSGDSDVDSDVGESMSDESIALLAHEMLCCEHESDTDSGEDVDVEREDEEQEEEDEVDDEPKEEREELEEKEAKEEAEVDEEEEELDDEEEAEDEEEEADIGASTEHTYALLMCSEDDEDLELDSQLEELQQQQQQQKQLLDPGDTDSKQLLD